MRTSFIDVDDRWGVVLCHDFTLRDADQLAAVMETFGMHDERKIRKSLRVLLGINGGMAISRADLRMSAVFIGAASDRDQWVDTIAHELDHVQDAILDHYGIPQGSEDAAYLQGYVARKAAKVLGDWYCPTCGR